MTAPKPTVVELAHLSNLVYGGSPSVKGWESAVKDGEKALEELERFTKANPGVQTEAIGEYRAAVEEHLSEIYLHLANHWATRTSYNKALVQVNAVLAMNPKHEQALSMRNRITAGAGRGRRWLGLDHRPPPPRWGAPAGGGAALFP